MTSVPTCTRDCVATVSRCWRLPRESTQTAKTTKTARMSNWPLFCTVSVPSSVCTDGSLAGPGPTKAPASERPPRVQGSTRVAAATAGVWARRERTNNDPPTCPGGSEIGIAVVEQRRLHAHRRAQAEVPPGGGGRHPSPGRPADEALAHEERLGDRLDRLRLLAHGDGERRQPDRTSPEPRAQSLAPGPVPPR